MNEKDRQLRERVADNLRFAAEVSRKVERIRDLFESKLRERPLIAWSPVWGDFGRREVWGYENRRLEGEFTLVVPPQPGIYEFQPKEEVVVGRYDLTLIASDSDLPNSPLEILGTIGGYEAFDYVLPPVTRIANMSQEQVENLQAKVSYLESLLRLIGLHPDEKVDSEEV